MSKSPERHTFQLNNYVKRCEDENKPVDESYVNFWKTAKEQDEENFRDPKWQKDNMEYDLRSTQWILDKVRGDEVYAQHLYAAMCNNEFTKRDLWPVLSEKKWSASWRHAGGIIADMREEGDYIDWYCSSIRDIATLEDEQFQQMTREQQEHYLKMQAFVSESVVTEEIENDLYELGWLVVKYNGDEDY